MEIEKLVEVFEALLPMYKDAYEKNFNYLELHNRRLENGLCYASDIRLGKSISGIFMEGYYKNLLTFKPTWVDGPATYLFKRPKTGKDLRSRIDFMESEIVDLKRLLKKGYTHV